jgi:hypothetical protein
MKFYRYLAKNGRKTFFIYETNSKTRRNPWKPISMKTDDDLLIPVSTGQKDSP